MRKGRDGGRRFGGGRVGVLEIEGEGGGTGPEIAIHAAEI